MEQSFANVKKYYGISLYALSWISESVNVIFFGCDGIKYKEDSFDIMGFIVFSVGLKRLYYMDCVENHM
ncbi:hypothetical protein, partial [Gallibacterium sp. AGMB14963]|uniref:hypothetical protein n=1 Tax=Gallibacterium faecale TaxID=3019086 RepID=UPI0022F1595D